MLPRADAERLQVDAALVVEYPGEGVGDLCAEVIASSTFKFRGSVGRATHAESNRKAGESFQTQEQRGRALSQLPAGCSQSQRCREGH